MADLPLPTREESVERFRERRFGIFLHWGLYAIPARNEWVRHNERTTDAEYQIYFEAFDPDRYDPRAWAEAIADAGARYAVITTKHHDGFCLWDSDLTDYQATRTPAGRDLIAPFAEAMREHGLGIGFYHSLIDWHHPQFPIDGLHPLRDDAEARAEPRDIAVYRAYLHGQMRELLTRYGALDELWLDFSYSDHIHEGVQVWGGKGAKDWGSEELLAMVRELQPGVLVNDRLEIPGDFTTPEQYQPVGRMLRDGEPVLWEACQTLNNSWGYHRDNHDYKSSDLLVRMLIDTVSKDGNFLLNVGPDARGAFDPRAAETLRAIGAWMRLHDRSIHGAGPSELTAPQDCRYTQRGNRLYLHIFAWPFEMVHLSGLAGRVAHAQFLHDGSEVRTEVSEPETEAYATRPAAQAPDTLTLLLPIQRPDLAVPVVELILRDPA